MANYNTVIFRMTNVRTGKTEKIKVCGNNPEQGQQELYIMSKHFGIVNNQAYQIAHLFEPWTAFNNSPKAYKKIYQDPISGIILEVRRLDIV